MNKLAPAAGGISSRSRLFPKRSHEGNLFGEQQAQTAISTDRAFAVVLGIEYLAAIGLAIWIAPWAWEGKEWKTHTHVWAAMILGFIITAPPLVCVRLMPGSRWTRHVIAIAQMLMAALFIHLTAGHIETHFMIFGSLAFLAFYRDWTVLATATLIVFLDHLLRGIYFSESVFGVPDASNWLTVEHVWWVAFEDAFLIFAIFSANRVQKNVADEKVRELGQYVIQERLGSGGMGVVYLAEHRLLKRPCAIKLIREDLAGDKQVLNRFEREVHSTARLTHPNTVAVYDYGRLEDGTFYYVMEYLRGPSLQQLVEDAGPLPAGRAVYLLRQICRALHEAHSTGLIHRDIKPQNVQVCTQGGQYDVSKLLDFGLVRSVDDNAKSQLTNIDAMLGTPHYMSPEQVAGDPLDARSDLYSLGTVAYFMLTGHPAFDGPNAQAVMYARVSRPVEPPSVRCPGIPLDLEQIVLRCLARRPEERFADARSLERELAKCLCRDQWNEDRAAEWWSQWGDGQMGVAELAAETPIQHSSKTMRLSDPSAGDAQRSS